MESLAYWRGLLNRTRRRVVLLRLAEVAAAFLAAAASWLAVFTAVDRAWRLPQAGCWCAWAGGVGVLLAAAVALAGLARRRWQDPALALLLERGLPDADNRLVNAVQLAESAEPVARTVAAQLLEELRARHPEPRFHRIHPAGRLAGLAVAAILGTLLLGVLYLVDPPATAQSWRRALFPARGEPAYAVTRVLRVQPGDTVVRRGDPWAVQACTGGETPAVVALEFAGRGGETWTQGMTAVRKKAAEAAGSGAGVWWEWSAPVAVQEGRYRVLAGDGRSSWFRLELALPPVLAAWKAVVEPPAYTHLPTATLDRQTPSLEVPAGSKVTLEGRGGTPLTRVRLLGDGARELAAAPAAGDAFSLTWAMPDGGGLAVELTDRHKLNGISPLPLRPMPDAPPRVQWWETRGPLVATTSAELAPGLLAVDDYGVARIGLQLLPDSGAPRDLVAQDVERQPGRQWRGRLKLGLAQLGLRPGMTARLRGFAEDHGLRAAARRGFTPVLEIRLEDRRDLAQERRGQARSAQTALAELIQWQRDNVRETRRLAEAGAGGGTVAEAPVRVAGALQEKIRGAALQLAAQGAALGEVAVLLAELADGDMAQAIASLEAAGAAPPAGRGQPLQQAERIENRILARLTGGATSMAGEGRHQEKTDLLTLLRRLADGQRQNLAATQALAKQPSKAARTGAPLLARRQDALANDLTAFQEQAADLLQTPGDEIFAGRLRQARELLNKAGVYEAMLTAAEALDAAEPGRAGEPETLALKGLFQALDILNRWAVENARQEAAAAAKTLAAVDDALGKLERQQAKIVETTHALAARGGVLDDATRKQLAAMDAEQKPMADLVEKLAQDLYQFPDLPVCNELNSRMREIFEDVQQAAASADAPSLEIAVQKEDSLLDAIRNTKDRVKDVEMWLPNVPDNIVWNMESFDADEFPNMPLVPLPDELEDIVGDLLEQAKSVAEQSQDTTGNNMMADAEMGWGIMDGPMPSFGAKGKSGNMRPNDNEMTGRSGAGREGQSNGEMVENQAKGLEGTETKARRTQDAFQKGQVNEAADSTLDARATGGGKVGGQSESVGMFGQAPRRDAYVGDHAPNPVALRQEAEALYTRSRLLYLGTGGLGEVTRELRKLEAARRLPAFAPLARQVIRELERVRVGGDGGTVLAPSLDGRETRGGAAVQDVDLGQIRDAAYREMVEHYFRDLDAR